jgi:hypothetical protein
LLVHPANHPYHPADAFSTRHDRRRHPREQGSIRLEATPQTLISRLAIDPRCVVTTENAVEPVVVEGLAEVVSDPEALTRMLALENAKHQTDYSTSWTRLSTPRSVCGRVGRSVWSKATSPALPPVGSSGLRNPNRRLDCGGR